MSVYIIYFPNCTLKDCRDICNIFDYKFTTNFFAFERISRRIQSDHEKQIIYYFII